MPISYEETEIKSSMQLKGGLFPLTTLQLLTKDLQILEEQLNEKIQQAPNFFNNAPIVIDLYYLSEENLDFIDFVALKKLLIKKNLVPVGVKNANKHLQTLATEANLAILRSNNSFENHSKYPGSIITKEKDSINKKIKIKENKKINQEYNQDYEDDNFKDVSLISNSQPITIKNKLIVNPVRSGQQIYAPDGDITVLGSVSNGAELLADGNIHVYGALRGRALAGLNNNTQARIFCSSLEADLISIAGQFKISENIEAKFWKKAVQIQLLEGKLFISEL